MTPPLRLDHYQQLASRTDQTRSSQRDAYMPVLGLVGEIGGLLSETKKKQRDALSYVGYHASVEEEIGDALWYLSTIANHEGLAFSSLATHGSPQDQLTFDDLQPQQTLALDAPTIGFERTLLNLAGAVGQLASSRVGSTETNSNVHAVLFSIMGLILDAANEAGIVLGVAAVRNLQKTDDRWPSIRQYPDLFDEVSLPEERLPRALTIEIFERIGGNGKNYVVQSCNGVFIGDRLTDNIMTPDDYRFHDAFHYAYAAILGWSPVTRALFKLKRKSEVRVDEGQDGARAILIEEGVATYVFGEAKTLGFYDGQKNGDLGLSFLKSVRRFVRGYEPEASPLWLWEEAILAGSQAFRFLRKHRRGTLVLNLDKRTMEVQALER